MTEFDVKRLALVYSLVAKLEGMKLDNIIADSLDRSRTYNPEKFFDVQQELEHLSYSHDQQLFG